MRTLCVDFGKSLGIRPIWLGLVRTESGPFTLEDCFHVLTRLKQMAASSKMLGKYLVTRLDEGIRSCPT